MVENVAENVAPENRPILPGSVERVPDKIANTEGGWYNVLPEDKAHLAIFENCSDDELEQIYYIMTPMEHADPAQEYKDLLKYLNMSERIYTLMYKYAGSVIERRNKDRNSLTRINPTRHSWRRPALED